MASWRTRIWPPATPSAWPSDARCRTIRALLLAAGEGTRLRPLTLDRPKPMLPVGGRPVLEHLIGLLREHDITEIAINLHYQPHAIVNHFGDGSAFGVRITYSHEERLLGSAGAAKKLEWFFDDTFAVIYGDLLAAVDLAGLERLHRASGACGTLALYEVPDPSRCGIVQLDAAGRIRQFVEKPAPGLGLGNLANAGIYLLEPVALRHIPVGRACDFGRDLFPRLLELGLPLYGQLTGGYVLDMGSIERYAQAQLDHADGLMRPRAA